MNQVNSSNSEVKQAFEVEQVKLTELDKQHNNNLQTFNNPLFIDGPEQQNPQVPSTNNIFNMVPVHQQSWGGLSYFNKQGAVKKSSQQSILTSYAREVSSIPDEELEIKFANQNNNQSYNQSNGFSLQVGKNGYQSIVVVGNDLQALNQNNYALINSKMSVADLNVNEHSKCDTLTKLRSSVERVPNPLLTNKGHSMLNALRTEDIVIEVNEGEDQDGMEYNSDLEDDIQQEQTNIIKQQQVSKVAVVYSQKTKEHHKTLLIVKKQKEMPQIFDKNSRPQIQFIEDKQLNSDPHLALKSQIHSQRRRKKPLEDQERADLNMYSGEDNSACKLQSNNEESASIRSPQQQASVYQSSMLQNAGESSSRSNNSQKQKKNYRDRKNIKIEELSQHNVSKDHMIVILNNGQEEEKLQIPKSYNSYQNNQLEVFKGTLGAPGRNTFQIQDRSANGPGHQGGNSPFEHEQKKHMTFKDQAEIQSQFSWKVATPTTNNNLRRDDTGELQALREMESKIHNEIVRADHIICQIIQRSSFAEEKSGYSHIEKSYDRPLSSRMYQEKKDISGSRLFLGGRQESNLNSKHDCDTPSRKGAQLKVIEGEIVNEQEVEINNNNNENNKTFEDSDADEDIQEKLKYPYDRRSLCIFSYEWIFRLKLIAILESRIFEYIMTSIILLNSINLALYDFNDRDSLSTYNKVLDMINIAFSIVFITEACAKIIAFGLIIHYKAYMRSGWNLIDLVVVISGSANLKSLRVIRVFRPFKSINVMPSMKQLIQTLIQSLPDFANVGTFLVYVFLLFATMGLHQYNGLQYNICRFNKEPEHIDRWEFDQEIQRVCSRSGLGYYSCPNNEYCGNNEEFPKIDLATDDIEIRSYIDYGIINFDNLGTALLTIFQIVNSDTWHTKAINLMDADIPIIGAVYCVLLIIVGQFFLMNLILAVIIFAFIKTQKRDLQSDIKELCENEKYETDEKSHRFTSMNQIEDRSQPPSFFQNEESQSPNIAPVKKQATIAKESLTTKIARGQIKKFSPNEDDPKLNETTPQNQDEENLTAFLRPQAQKRKVANMFISSKGQNISVKGGTDLMNPMDTLKRNEISCYLDQTENIEPINIEDMNAIRIGTMEKLDSNPQTKKLSLFGELQANSKEADPKTIKKQNMTILEENSLSDESQNLDIKEPQFSLQWAVINEEFKFDDGLPRNINDPNNNNDFKQQKRSLTMKKVMWKEGDQIKNEELKNQGSTELIAIPKFNSDGEIIKALQGSPTISSAIEERYKNYFKNILDDAKQNFQESNEDFYDKANMRELVGLRVGLDILKENKLQEILDEKTEKWVLRAKGNRFIKISYYIIHQNWFEVFMTICIIFSTFFLALDRYPVQMAQAQAVEQINIVFTMIFSMELLLKVISFGFKDYFKGSYSNIFDCIIVFISIVDVFLSIFIVDEQSGSEITALRGFRLLRIFKLAKSWKRFELLIETLGRTLVDITTFSVLLFLLIFTFTLLGLELFAHRCKLNPKTSLVDLKNGKSPLINFDNFLNSFTTVFIILTNDGFSAIYYDHYRTVGGVSATCFFILLAIFGQKILLNLFLAILLENFDEGAFKQNMHEYEQEQNQIRSIGPLTFKERMWNLIDDAKERITIFCNRFSNNKEVEKSEELRENIALQRKNAQIQTNKPKLGLKQILNAEIKSDIPEIYGISLNFLPVDNKFRIFIFRVVTHRFFEMFINVSILISAIQLAVDSPIIDPASTLKQSCFWIDLCTTIVFILEFILKVLAFGFMTNGQHSYLRHPWNILDFIIIIFSGLSLTPLSDDLRSIKIFRVLRLLRLISKNESLKVAVRALFFAVPNVTNVTIIMLLIFLVFGVVLVSYFKGKLFYCQMPISDLEESLRSKWDCLSAGGDWVSQVYNFDNSLQALVTLFVMSTTAGWTGVMFNCVHSTQIDYLPDFEKPRSPLWVFFFIIFMIVGSFFFLNLFVGVVISTFNSENDKIGGNDLLTEKQKEWIDLRLLVLRSSPMRQLQQPSNRFRAFFFRVQKNPLFDKVILIIIVLNTVVLTLKWYKQPPEIEAAAENLNYLFTLIFFSEAIIKLIAMRPQVYFRDGWNMFDFSIIVGSFLSLFISANTTLEIRGAVTIMRSFRLLRLLRLIKRGKNLQLIFNTFVITLHSLVNIGGLLILFIFMYSILGMIIFGNVKRNNAMNDYINFESFSNAFFTLFVIATGDSWDQIMSSFAFEKTPSAQCIEFPSYADYVKIGNYNTVGCGNKNLTMFYFVSYMFVVNLIFLKIFIAIILQGYNDTQTQDGRLFNNDMNDKFKEVWTQFDPDATSFIKLHQFRPFLIALGGPLGFDVSYIGQKFLQDQFIASLELPIYQDFSSYQYLDVLDALSFRLMILDHIIKTKYGGNFMLTRRMTQADRNNFINQEIEYDTKNELQLEINKLLFQKNSDTIIAVKEVSDKETRRVKKKEKTRDKSGLTSSHHMAAEATLRKMQAWLAAKKAPLQEDIPISIPIPEPKPKKEFFGFKAIKTLGLFKNDTDKYSPKIGSMTVSGTGYEGGNYSAKIFNKKMNRTGDFLINKGNKKNKIKNPLNKDGQISNGTISSQSNKQAKQNPRQSFNKQDQNSSMSSIQMIGKKPAFYNKDEHKKQDGLSNYNNGGKSSEIHDSFQMPTWNNINSDSIPRQK